MMEEFSPSAEVGESSDGSHNLSIAQYPTTFNRLW